MTSVLLILESQVVNPTSVPDSLHMVSYYPPVHSKPLQAIKTDISQKLKICDFMTQFDPQGGAQGVNLVSFYLPIFKALNATAKEII